MLRCVSFKPRRTSGRPTFLKDRCPVYLQERLLGVLVLLRVTHDSNVELTLGTSLVQRTQSAEQGSYGRRPIDHNKCRFWGRITAAQYTGGFLCTVRESCVDFHRVNTCRAI